MHADLDDYVEGLDLLRDLDQDVASDRVELRRPGGEQDIVGDVEPQTVSQALDLDLPRGDLGFEIRHQTVVGRLHRLELRLPRHELGRNPQMGVALRAEVAVQGVGALLQTFEVAGQGRPHDPFVLVGLLGLHELLLEAVALDREAIDAPGEAVALALEPIAFRRDVVEGRPRDTSEGRRYQYEE